jgi:hypothetical protein
MLQNVYNYTSYAYFTPDTFILSIVFKKSSKNFSGISHNVPAVYDVFAVAIKEREAFQQLQKCG